MPIIDDPYWAARMSLSPDDWRKMRDTAETKARAAYHEATRAMATGADAAGDWVSGANSAVDKFKTGVQAQFDDLLHRAGEALQRNPAAQAGGAAFSLHSNYDAMRDANWKDADKYFHCKGNCEASQLGPAADWTATHLANGREVYGQYVKHASALG